MASRREFLKRMAVGGEVLRHVAPGPTAFAASEHAVRSTPAESDRRIRLAVVGGGFGAQFFWHEHPNCVVAAATGLYPARRERRRKVYRCDNVYDSLEEMLANKKSLLWNPDGSPSWRQNQSPMHYPTHSVSFVVGVTGERITKVSCLGWGDRRLLANLKHITLVNIRSECREPGNRRERRQGIKASLFTPCRGLTVSWDLV